MAKVSCRKAFTQELLELAKADSSIYTMATDSRGSVTSTGFFEKLPGQSAEAGIAEQNAVAMAAGLGLMGKNVFVAGPACFLAARAYEQIKVDIAYNRTNVKIIGVSAGASYGPLGCTHTSLHDYAGMRCLPGMQIFAPSDAVQTRFLTRYLAGHEGPAYMRMGRGDVEAVYEEGETFEVGHAKQMCSGKDVTLVACGEMVWHAVQAAALLQKKGVSARVLDMFTLAPFDEGAVRKAAAETKAIVTVEEHSIFGGLGEMTAHIVAESVPVRMKLMGFPDEACRVGKQEDLLCAYGLTAAHIAGQAEALMRR